MSLGCSLAVANMATQTYSLILLSFFIAITSSSTIDVTISGVGKVRGQTTNVTGELVDTFWGIPFAKPPIGKLRFAPPEPSEPWTGVRNASFVMHFCPQASVQGGRLTGVEDCLYLNIFRPKTALAGKLPVMFWVHGGGYMTGSGSLYPGQVLAGMHNVIIVTINYRLGVLGFFNIRGTETKGNYGLLDQILALKWVKQHIADFGGDASKVTIFGESAGGSSVSLLMLSPLAKGLFSKVIAQSGSALNYWSIMKNSTNTTQAEEYCANLGCKDLKTATSCLKKKSIKDILKWQHVTEDFTIMFPNVDGHVFSGLPRQQMEDGTLPSSNVDLMIGFNTDEGSMFLPNVTQWNKVTYETEIRKRLALQYGFDNELVTKLVSFYYQSYIKPDSMNYKKAFKEFLDDYMFKEGIVRLAMEWSKKTKNTYMYHFSYLPKYLTRPDWGVAHAMDLFFVFGLPFFHGPMPKFLVYNTTAEDKVVSLKVMKMWTDFAKTGSPGKSLQAMDIKTRKYFEINKNVSVKENYDPKMMAFWNDYIPEVIKMKTSKKEDCPSASTSNYQYFSTIAAFFSILVTTTLLS